MNQPDFGQTTSDYMLSNEFSNYLSTSFHALGYVNAGYYNNNVAISSDFEPLSEGGGLLGMLGKQESGVQYEYIAAYSSKLNDNKGVYYFDSNKLNLASNEVIISFAALSQSEFIINGEKKHLSDISDYQTCVKNEFDRKYKEKLQSLGISINAGIPDSILAYYNSFTKETYVYNSSVVEWSGHRYDAAFDSNEIQRNAQKEALSEFFRNFSVGGCISADKYFVSEEPQSRLLELCRKRFTNCSTTPVATTWLFLLVFEVLPSMV